MTDSVQVEPIVVAGRSFRPAVNTTFEQDFFIMERVGESGADRIEVKDNSDLTALGTKIILDAYRTGKLFELVAGMMVEDGVKWTKQSAMENAEFFGNLTDTADKRALQDALVGVLLSFFVNAADFSVSSQKSSEKDSGSEGMPLELLPNELIGESSSAVLGQKSSESWQGMTPINMPE